jgi:hypothetical protein
MVLKTCAFLTVTITAANLVSATTAHAVIAEGVTTGIVLNKLYDQFSDLIDKARDSGDFITWRVAITGRDLIDSFQKANSQLLNIKSKPLDW